MLFLEKMAVELDIFKSINCHNAPWPHLLHNILFESLIVKKLCSHGYPDLKWQNTFFGTNETAMKKKTLVQQ